MDTLDGLGAKGTVAILEQLPKGLLGFLVVRDIGHEALVQVVEDLLVRRIRQVSDAGIDHKMH